MKIYFHQAKYQFSFLKQNNLNILAELAARKAKTHTYIEWLFMEISDVKNEHFLTERSGAESWFFRRNEGK